MDKEKKSWDDREVGALWLKEGTTPHYKGYFKDESGKSIRVVIFKNKHKKQDNHPDLRIYTDE